MVWIHLLQCSYKLWRDTENLSAVMVFSSAILFFPVSLIVSSHNFSVSVSTLETEKSMLESGWGNKGGDFVFRCQDHTGNTTTHPWEWWCLSCKERSRNFAQIFLLPKSVVIMDLIDYMFTFSLPAIMLSASQWSPVCRLCTMSNSLLEVVFDWPLRVNIHILSVLLKTLKLSKCLCLEQPHPRNEKIQFWTVAQQIIKKKQNRHYCVNPFLESSLGVHEC
jgi:hypothetical protein